MLPKAFKNLEKHFEKYPGIGPRQATRFAFFVLKQPQEQKDDFLKTLKDVSESMELCSKCYIPMEKNKEQLCRICSDAKRMHSSVCVVEKESDALNIEKTGLHKGTYLILGENISPIGESLLAKERLRKLAKEIKSSKNKKEIILALNNTREGNFTSLYIQEFFKKNLIKNNAKITSLGRGLSTGSELEYADEDTLRNALGSRK